MTIAGTNIRTLADLNPSATPTTTASPNGVTGGQTLGKDQFMQLMIAQLKAQDPLNPADNTQFLAQLAQFSTLEGITNLNDSMSTMAASMKSSVASEASALVGRSVLVPTDQTIVEAGSGLSGNVDLTSDVSDLNVQITDQSGAIVKTIDMGAQKTGTVRFDWDGTNDAGVAQPTGVYKVKALSGGGSGAQAFSVDLPEYVVSVSIGSDGMQLNLAGGTSVPVDSVKEIQ
ncbi:MAG TPA: flagellar hook assembly protein FlgD [Pseudomonadales bacterium]|nr:flagellar hook assembly protein FlgD [Pseudomonadales bacterium]